MLRTRLRFLRLALIGHIAQSVPRNDEASGGVLRHHENDGSPHLSYNYRRPVKKQMCHGVLLPASGASAEQGLCDSEETCEHEVITLSPFHFFIVMRTSPNTTPRSFVVALKTCLK